jgi:SAM-dependent methyltransferase
MKEVYLPSLKKKLKDLFRPPKIVLNNPEVERKIRESFRCNGENTLVLNVGSGIGRMGDNVINLEIGLFPDVDAVGNGENLPFFDESFDVVYSNALLEHVPEPELILKEMKRVLKRGGLIWGFIPFLQPYHGYPFDYQRYTITGIKHLFSKYFSLIETGVWSGPSSALTWILRDYIKMLIPFSDREFFKVIFNGILNLFLFPLKYLDYILLKRKDSYTLASVVYFLGKRE